MPEAVIVAAARSPIGRAFKGAFKDTKPDQLAAKMVRAALDQVPELDPASISGEESLFRSFPFVMLVAANLLIVTGRHAPASRSTFEATEMALNGL